MATIGLLIKILLYFIRAEAFCHIGTVHAHERRHERLSA